jgi:hypothetical protein
VENNTDAKKEAQKQDDRWAIYLLFWSHEKLYVINYHTLQLTLGICCCNRGTTIALACLSDPNLWLFNAFTFNTVIA